jgi:tRNA-splicing ligase RtcB (3'-phosphate/5'-hydroxy nucleic acid ligase)
MDFSLRTAHTPRRAPADRWQGVRRRLEEAGIAVRSPSVRGLAEEAPFAYKDVDRVVAVIERAGVARRIARLAPIGVYKG